MCACVRVCVYLCVSVCKRERERDKREERVIRLANKLWRLRRPQETSGVHSFSLEKHFTTSEIAQTYSIFINRQRHTFFDICKLL